jgi:hypothetical protein
VFSIDGTGVVAATTGLKVGSTPVQVVGAQQAAEADIDASNDPGDGTLAGLSFSSTVTQAQVDALKAECEKLRDFAAGLRTTINSLLAKIRTHGLIAT